MEIKYLKNSEIDREKWDACVERAFNTRIYAMSWYLDAVADYWDALVADDYAMVFPLTYYKRLGMCILRQPVNTQQLGIFSKKALEHDVILRFLRAIPKKFVFGTLHLNAGNKIKVNKEFPVEYRVNIELDISEPIETIRENYANHIKRNLKKAEKNHVEVREGFDYKRIIRCFKENRGSKRYHVPENCYKAADRLYENLMKKGVLYILDAYDREGEFVAGNVLALFQDRVYALFSGSNEKGYKILARFLLLDQAIALGAQEKKIFDFEGSNTESLAFAYHSMGGVTVPYPVVTISHIPKVFTWMFFGLKKVFRQYLAAF